MNRVTPPLAGWRFGLLLAATYFVIARAGLHFATVNPSVSPIWPATGFAIAALSTYGRRYWPAITAGALATNLTTGVPAIGVALIVVGNTLEALLAAWVFGSMRRRAENLFGSERFLSTILASLIATPVSATIGATGLLLGHAVPVSDFDSIWVTWWTGDTLGTMLFAPFFLNLFNDRPLFSPQRYRLPAVLALTGLVAFWIFRGPAGSLHTLFFLYPLVLIATYALRAFEAGLVTLLVGAVAVKATLAGHGPFHAGTTNENLVFLAIFLGSLAITELILRFIRETTASRTAIYVLLVGWVIGGAVLRAAGNHEETLDRARFFRLVGQAMENFRGRSFLYESALRGAAGLFHSASRVTPKVWENYVGTLDLDRNYPGMLGMAYLNYVPRSEMNAYRSRMREEHHGHFRITPVESGGAYHPEYHFVVSGIEPAERNRLAVGLDIATDPVRRTAAIRAATTGLPAMTLPIHLVQDAKSRQGLALYVPLYRRAMTTPKVLGLNHDLLGWISAPVLVEDLVRDVLAGAGSEIGFRLQLETASGERHPVFASEPGRPADSFEAERVLSLWGHRLVFHWSRTPTFFSRRDATSAWMVFACATLAALLAAFVCILETLTRRANLIAVQKTRELAEREQIWRSLTQHAPVGIFRLRKDRRLSFANPLFQELCQSVHPESTGWDFAEAVHPEDREAFEAEWNALKERSTELIQAQIRLRKTAADAEREIWVALAVIQLRHENEVVGYIGTIQDLSEIRAQQARLEHSSRLATLGQMAGGIAHEINNPLAILSGRAQLLAKRAEHGEPSAETVQETCAKILETVNRIAKIVNGLRSFSRSGDRDPFHATPLGRVHESVVDFCNERFRTLRIDFHVDVPATVEVVCREVQLVQVLLNLLNNAADAVVGSPRPWIRLHTEITESDVRFVVTDSGTGIPSWIARNMMNPFFTTKPVGQGTGLGLSISSAIAEDHGGSLRYVEGAPNTQFVFTVSRKLPEGERPRTESGASARK